jgi:hypothetical protein
MPFGDRTGPQGLGPMTGRAAGHCAGYSVPGYANPVPGRGWGRGFGGGRGWGRGFGGGRGWGRGFGWGPPWGAPYGPYAPAYAPAYGPAYAPSYGPEDEVTALKDQARYFEGALEEIKKRLEEVETSAEEK